VHALTRQAPRQPHASLLRSIEQQPIAHLRLEPLQPPHGYIEVLRRDRPRSQSSRQARQLGHHARPGQQHRRIAHGATGGLGDELLGERRHRRRGCRQPDLLRLHPRPQATHVCETLGQSRARTADGGRRHTVHEFENGF